MDQLHAADFLERVQRSAHYFHDTLVQLMGNALDLTKNVESKNKQAMRRLTETYGELKQTYAARTLLLSRMAAETFSTAAYLTNKQEAMLDVMDDGPARQKRERKKKETTAKEPKAPKEKTQEVSFRSRSARPT